MMNPNNAAAMRRGTTCSNPYVADKKQLKMEVYQIGFMMVETILYLDTHPSDREALSYYNDLKERYYAVMKAYSENFAPLLADRVEADNYWKWVATPMPWEVEDC